MHMHQSCYMVYTVWDPWTPCKPTTADFSTQFNHTLSHARSGCYRTYGVAAACVIGQQ